MVNNIKLNYLLIILLFLLIILIPREIQAKKIYNPESGDPITELCRWHSYPEMKGEGIWMASEGTKGTIWFFGDGNLFFYDGLEWRVYNPENSILSFKGEFSLSPICVTRNNEIYIGDNEGICKLADKNWERIFPFKKNLKCSIYWIIEGSDGSIWAGTEMGAMRIKEKTYTLYTSEKIKKIFKNNNPFLDIKVLPKLPEPIENSESFDDFRIFETHNKLWFFIQDYEENKCLLHSKYPIDRTKKAPRWELITEESGLEIGFNTHILETNDGTIWVTSVEEQKGIYTYNPLTKTFSRVDKLDKFDINYRSYSIVQSNDGSILIGDGGKVFIYKNNEWKIYTSDDLPIPKADIGIATTAAGDIWLHGIRQDVFKIDHTDKHWLSYDNLNFQCENDRGIKWFLTIEGTAVTQKDDKWTEYNEEDGLINTPVILKYTKDGNLWAAGSHNGKAATAYFKNDRWVRQIHPDLSWGVGHLAVCELLDGSILFGSGTECRGYKGGIKQYKSTKEGEEWTHHTSPSMAHLLNYTIEQTPDGTIWIGGMNLSKFDRGNWEILQKPEKLSIPWISYLHVSLKGNLWVSRHGGGIYHFAEKEWSHYSIDDGLASNTISSITNLDRNIILASTDKGISAYDGKSWTDHIFSQHFSMPLETGLLKKDKEGSLWINLTTREWYFRGLTGEKFNRESLSRFKTIRYKKDTIPPETQITFGLKEVGTEGNTSISWEGKDAWNTTSSEELEFSFRIDKGQWSPFIEDRNKLFLGLANGNHVFEVRARDTDFNIDPSPAILKFRVKAPFWKQPWFILIIGSLLVITIYQTIGLIKRNEQLKRIAERLKKSNKELKEFAYIVSHDLKEPLRGIVQLTEWTLEDSHNEIDKKSKDNLKLLKERTIHMNNMIQGILEYSRIGRMEDKAKKIDLNKLVKETIDLLSPPDNIKITVEDKLPEYIADRTRLTQLFENLLSNAIKYMDKPEGIIKIQCYEKEKEWEFSISDNGPGIEEKYFKKIFKLFNTLPTNPESKSTGIGLTIVKKLIDLYNGKIWVESKIGKGTTFYFTLPKNRNV